MPTHPMFDALVANETITQEMAHRAAQVPPHTASSVVGKLIAVGADPTRTLRAVAELAAIPVASRAMIASSAPVQLPQTTARALRMLNACPASRDAQGTLHVLISEPDVQAEVARFLPGCAMYLAQEDQVRDLLIDYYPSGSSIPDGAPVGAIDIDMEASSRLPAAPAAPQPAPITRAPMSVAPAPLPADPLAPRASGPMKLRSFTAEDETQRIERAPRARGAEERTVEDAVLPAAARKPERSPVDRAFWRGVGVGAGVTAAVAAVIIVAVLLS